MYTCIVSKAMVTPKTRTNFTPKTRLYQKEWLARSDSHSHKWSKHCGSNFTPILEWTSLFRFAVREQLGESRRSWRALDRDELYLHRRNRWDQQGIPVESSSHQVERKKFSKRWSYSPWQLPPHCSNPMHWEGVHHHSSQPLALLLDQQSLCTFMPTTLIVLF